MAALVYVSDTSPGITRHRSGSGFFYRRPDGKRLTDAEELRRIRALAVPPAYTQVWISPRADGHLQATGRDARGRKQYRYHAEWRAEREAQKYDRLLDFAAVLPRIRSRVRRDLAETVGARLSREAVIAGIVRLLDTTMVRVGNDEYARSNGSFGLTTLRNRHAAVQGRRLRLRFRGKSGVVHEIEVDDARVARIVARCQSLPGQELFQYLDDEGETHAIGSADVNDYLRETSGGDFTAKDFRTWHGSVHALALGELLDPEVSAVQARRMLANQVLRQVAARLGNTVAVCRKSYVHPGVLALLLGETMPASTAGAPPPRAGLHSEERRFAAFLRAAAPPRRRGRAKAGAKAGA